MCKLPYSDTFVCLRCLCTPRHMTTSLETEVPILGTCYVMFFEGKGA